MQDEDFWTEQTDLPQQTEDQAQAQSLDFDIACVRCGYNLRGALPTGTCPECGEPVDNTLRPDLLHMADTAWLGKLRKGSQWLVTAIIMNLALIPIAMVVGFASVASNPSAASAGSLPLGAMIFITVLGLVVTATYGVAAWNLSEPEPNKIETRISCLLMRWLILPSMVVGAFTEFLNYSDQDTLLYTAVGIDFVTSIAMLVGFLAGLWYLRTLAERIPEPSLAKQTLTVYWGYMISMSIGTLLGTAIMFFAVASANSANPNTMGAVGALGLVMCPVGLAILVFIIWAIVLMFRYRTRFAQAHKISKKQHRAALRNSY